MKCPHEKLFLQSHASVSLLSQKSPTLQYCTRTPHLKNHAYFKVWVPKLTRMYRTYVCTKEDARAFVSQMDGARSEGNLPRLSVAIKS